MKKLLMIVLLFSFVKVVNSQNYLYMSVTEIGSFQTVSLCTNEYDGIVLQKDPNCSGWIHWRVMYESGEEYNYSTDEITVTPIMPSHGNSMEVLYNDNCEVVDKLFFIEFQEFNVSQPWSQDHIWKRTDDQVTLTVNGGYNYQWSTGSQSDHITVTNPGTYWVRVYNDCGELYDTIQVRDNVEIELATCDLETNLNMVTWPTTPAQAEYVSQVEIKRDGLVVGTAPYTDGYFLDNIGSDAASRTYTVTALATDGTPCPITSYPKETIHMAYLTGINNTIEVNWNAPTGYDLLGYNICEWHESDGSLSVIDYVGASVTSYTCSQSQFDQGYIVVQGVDAGKDGETRLLSNRSMDLVGLGENESTAFKVYPNPAKDRFIVEGSGTMTITNTFGQTFLRREIDGKTTIELPQGMYFVKLGGVTRKVVVE